MVSINTTLRAFCRLVDTASAVTGQGTWRGETRAASRVVQGELKVLSVRVASTYYDRTDTRTEVLDAGNATSHHNLGGQAGGY